MLLETYRADYGQEQRLVEAEQILRNALQQGGSEGESTTEP